MKFTAITLRRAARIAAVCLLTAVSGHAFAQAAAAPAAFKAATITFNTAVLSTAEAKREFDALKTKYTPRQTKLQALNTDINTLKQQLQTSAQTLSEADRATREHAISEKQRQLQRQAEDLKTDSTNDSQQVYARLAQKVYTFLQSYGPQHGYTFIVERGSDANPIVWYADKSLDITAQVTKAYDAQAQTAPAAAPK